MELRPSKGMWDYYFKAQWEKGNITDLSVCSAIADLLGGFHISHTAKEVLKDLGLLTKDKPNKKAKEALSAYLHGMFHRGKSELIIVRSV